MLNETNLFSGYVTTLHANLDYKERVALVDSLAMLNEINLFSSYVTMLNGDVDYKNEHWQTKAFLIYLKKKCSHALE